MGLQRYSKWTGFWAMLCAALSVSAASSGSMPNQRLIIASPTTQPTQQAIPNQSAQAHALSLIQNVFKADFADHSPAGRRELARKLLDQGIATNDDPAAKFVLLDESAEMSIDAGDAAVLAKAIDTLSSAFAVDAVAMKSRSYAIIAPACWTPRQAEALTDACSAAIDQAITVDRYDEALRLQSVGQSAAARSQRIERIDEMRRRHDEILALRQQFAGAKSAMAELQHHPDNPGACTRVGSFLCFVKSNWSAGLAVLVHCDDAALRSAARADLANPNDPEALCRVADAWWEISLKQSPVPRQHLQTRAVDFYRRALPSLDGLSKTIAAQRISVFEAAQLREMHLLAGLVGRFFADQNFSELHSQRIDRQINFDWGHTPPAGLISKRDFSIRWKGVLRIQTPGLYTLMLQAREGARLLLDGKTVIETSTHRRTGQKVNLQLKAGLHELQIDYWNGTGLARCKLTWIAPGSLRELPVPEDALYHSEEPNNP